MFHLFGNSRSNFGKSGPHFINFHSHLPTGSVEEACNKITTPSNL